MKNYVIFLLAIIISSCDSLSSHESQVASLEMMSTNENPESAGTQVKPANSKIIKDGRICLQVADIKKAKSAIDALVNTHEGYYESENFNNTTYYSVYDLKVRMPSDKFDAFVLGVESTNGKITSKVVQTRDVTRQFIDLETRLENKQIYLKRYQDLLKQAKTINDILSIERSISALEEEIESTVKQLRYLSNQVDFSTLTLSVEQEREYIEKSVSFFFQLKNSLVQGWSGFVSFLVFLIQFWPFLIAIGAGIYFWRRNRAKKRG